MKLIIEHEQAASEDIEYRVGGRTPKYEHYGRFVGFRPNHDAWALGPYEKYLAIEVDMRLCGPNVVTIKRDMCDVTTHDEGTLAESYVWRLTRHTTRHYLTTAELGAAWPEIEQRKQEGVTLTVHSVPPIVINPYGVVNYSCI